MYVNHQYIGEKMFTPLVMEEMEIKREETSLHEQVYLRALGVEHFEVSYGADENAWDATARKKFDRFL